jgi:hypothetical protein
MPFCPSIRQSERKPVHQANHWAQLILISIALIMAPCIITWSYLTINSYKAGCYNADKQASNMVWRQRRALMVVASGGTLLLIWTL